MNCFRLIARTVLPVGLLLLTASWCVALEEGERERRQRGENRDRRRDSHRRFQRGLGKPILLRSEQVQKELQVSEKQKAGIDEAVTAYGQKSRQLFRGRRDLSEDERESSAREFQKKRDVLRKDTDKKLEALLSADQMKRLNEILLQQRGVSALTDAQVVRALKLTEEQSEDIKGVIKTAREERRKLLAKRRELGRDELGGIREKMKQIRKDVEVQALALLTDAQKEQFKALKGEPFELDRRSLRRGSRGRRGREGRRGQTLSPAGR